MLLYAFLFQVTLKLEASMHPPHKDRDFKNGYLSCPGHLGLQHLVKSCCWTSCLCLEANLELRVLRVDHATNYLDAITSYSG